MVEKELQVYIDGKYVPKSEAKISVFDHGLLYGDGVFEGIRIYDGVIFKLQDHLDRLYGSARAIMLKVPISKEEMNDAVIETLRRNNLRDAYIRLLVTRGVGDLGLDPRKCPKASIIIIAVPVLRLYEGEKTAKGMRMIISWIRRDPVDATSHEIKSLNYLNSVLSKIEANNADADEAIILDKQGLICEATGENVFIVKNERIYTPPSSTGALPGVTAKTIKKIAAKMGYDVVEANITVTELYGADEAFLTGSGAEILYISEVNKRNIADGKMGPITKRIISEFRNIVRDPNEGTQIY